MMASQPTIYDTPLPHTNDKENPLRSFEKAEGLDAFQVKRKSHQPLSPSRQDL